MSPQTATATVRVKAPMPVEKVAADNVFDRIQQTLQETKEEIKKCKTVYPEERM